MDYGFDQDEKNTRQTAPEMGSSEARTETDGQPAVSAEDQQEPNRTPQDASGSADAERAENETQRGGSSNVGPDTVAADSDTASQADSEEKVSGGETQQASGQGSSTEPDWNAQNSFWNSQNGSGSQSSWGGTDRDQNTGGFQNSWNGDGQNTAGSQSESADDENRQNGSYTSKYDAYRFQTPHNDGYFDPNEKPKKKKNRKKPDRKKPVNRTKTALAIAIVAVVALAAALVATNLPIRSSLSSAGSGASASEAESSGAESASNGMTFGNTSSSTSIADVYGSAGSTDHTDMTVADVAALAMPSMVQITNTSLTEYYNIFGQPQEAESVSAGSGIIIGENDDEYLIATNNHVISNSSEITVTFVDNNAVEGTIKGSDDVNDLAVVAVEKSDMEDSTKDAVRIISIGDSDACVVGEQVVAIGNALGYGQSVSGGYVSALNRDVTVNGATHELIQTDASINPGNSGGALLNMKGQLIGINEVKYVDSEVEGVGYAIPSATARPILEQLGNAAPKTEVSEDQASYMGITCMDMPSQLVSEGYPSGAYVASVVSGGPADQAGLKEGDIITGVAGTSVDGKDALVKELGYHAAGETVDFTISRLNDQGNSFISSKVSITLGSKADAPSDAASDSASADAGNEDSGDGTDGSGNGGFRFQLPGAW